MAPGNQEDNKKTVIGRPVSDQPVTLPETRLADPREAAPTQPQGRSPPPTRPEGGSHTKIVFGIPDLAAAEARPPVAASPTAAIVDAPASPRSENGPVVGWLVVIAGPGRGMAVEIYTGINVIGREPQNRISLNFGDAAISREKAASIAYDPLDFSFAVMPGESANIVRQNNTKVLSPHDLVAGDKITIGQTELRFVPLCGPDFNWGAS